MFSQNMIFSLENQSILGRIYKERKQQRKLMKNREEKFRVKENLLKTNISIN